MNETTDTIETPITEQKQPENSFIAMQRFKAEAAMQMERARRMNTHNNLLFPTPTAF